MNRTQTVSLTYVLVGALLAGMVQSAFVVAAASVLRVPLGRFTLFLGGLFTQDATTAILLGRIAFWAMAFVWGLLFVHFRRFVAEWSRSAVITGLLYGLLIWLVSSGLILPALAGIATRAGLSTDPGLFGFGWGGLTAAMIALVAHLLYGWVLAAFLPNDAGAVSDYKPETE